MSFNPVNLIDDEEDSFTPINLQPTKSVKQRASDQFSKEGIKDIARGTGRAIAREVTDVPDKLSALIDFASNLYGKKLNAQELRQRDELNGLPAQPKGLWENIMSKFNGTQTKAAPFGIGFSDIQNLLKSAGSENVLEKLGIQEPTTPAGKTIERFGSYGLLGLADSLGSVRSALAGQAAEESGAGPGAQTAAEIAVNPLVSIGRNPRQALQSVKSLLPKKKAETYASGLPKLKAEGNTKLANFAKVTPDQEQKNIAALANNSKETLTKTLKQKVPLYKELSEGKDFKSKISEDFSNLKKLAAKEDILMDVTPLQKSFRQFENDFVGVPLPSAPLKKSFDEIKAFQNKPSKTLEELYNIRQHNSASRSDLLDKTNLSSKERIWGDFLKKYNDAIDKSIEQTLGKDHPFTKSLENANEFYTNYKNAEKVSSILTPNLEEGFNVNSWKNLSKTKGYKELKDILGEKPAKELNQLGKDVVKAYKVTQTLKGKKIFSDVDKLLGIANLSFAPLSTFFPAIAGIQGATTAGYVGVKGAKYLAGHILSQPKTRREFSNLVKAINEDNAEAAFKAYVVLSKNLEGEDEDQ